MIIVAASMLIVATVISGIILVVRGSARTSGLLLTGAGLAAGAALVLHLIDRAPDAELVSTIVATHLAYPAAALTYPTWQWRRPVDFVASVTVIGAGVFAVVAFDDPGVPESMGAAIALTLIVYLWWRIEKSSGDLRVSLLWLAVTVGIVGLVIGLVMFAAEGAQGNGVDVVALLMCIPIGPAMVVGVLHPDLLDVRGLIVWGVVTFVTVIVYLSVFAGIVSGLDAAGANPSPGTLGLIGGVLALAVHPTLVLLRGVVDQLLFGDRPDPLQAATHVADQIGDDPVLALRAIREALVLPYASVRGDGQTLATSGTEVTHTRTLPLQLGGDAVGEIVVGLRAGDLTLAAADANVLRIVAPLLAQTLRSQALARDLQASRNAAITAIEEERRRLRRDLHDGLGPTLSGVAFATDAARNQLVGDPAAADVLLEKLRADTSEAIAEVRRLVEGLRPPALDELGLLGAVRQHAATLHADGGTPLQITISAPEPLPELSAAAEVTAYRIVVEALTNVARHAAATTAAVELSIAGDDLRLSVQDDGRGPRTWQPGVGMSSMRERAEQVGGTLSARSRADGGRVEARIPLGTS